MTNPLDVFQQIKKENSGSILLFRVGDFYEAFYDDAKTLAKLCGLTLTTQKGEDPVPTCGIPAHAIDGHLKTLKRAGHRIAICEQVSDPKGARVKKIVSEGGLVE